MQELLLFTSKFIIVGFSGFIILIGFLMLFLPEKARSTLRKAGSTNFINYAEITIRLIPAAAMVYYKDLSKFPLIFELFGWCMLLTSLVLYFVPRKFHHSFSNKSADILKPLYFQFISPFAFALGGFLIYCLF